MAGPMAFPDSDTGDRASWGCDRVAAMRVEPIRLKAAAAPVVAEQVCIRTHAR